MATPSRYTLIKGQYSVQNATNPRQGPEPDGDTIRFVPDSMDLVRGLRRFSGRAPAIRNGQINVRYEGVDALETHFDGASQNLAFANAARDRNLALLGFTNVDFFPDLPNVVRSVDRNPLPGYVIANGIESNGRLLGLVYAGSTRLRDGDRVFVDSAILNRSVNAQLVIGGLAYVEPYDTMPISLVQILRGLIGTARRDRTGMFASEDVNTMNRTRISNLARLEALVMWPKLFRRFVTYFKEGNTGLAQFNTWLRDDPIHRDDSLRLPDGEKGNMHDTFTISGNKLRLKFQPEDLLIAPDPSPVPGVTP